MGGQEGATEFREGTDTQVGCYRGPGRTKRKCSYTGLRGSSPGVPPVAAGAWLLPLSGSLGSLRKLEIGEACGAEEVEGTHEDPAPPSWTLTPEFRSHVNMRFLSSLSVGKDVTSERPGDACAPSGFRAICPAHWAWPRSVHRAHERAFTQVPGCPRDHQQCRGLEMGSSA